MIKLTSLIAILALAGCPLQKSGGTTTLGGPGGGTSSGGGGGGGGDQANSPDGMITMPNLVGKTRDEAMAMVKAAGFKHEAEVQPIACSGPDQEVGKVDCQDPDAGKSVKAYTLVRFNVKEGERLTGMFLRRHFDKLKGMPVEQAKAQAKKDGHSGEIRVKELDSYRDGCKQNTVCEATDERGGQSGMDSKDALLLHTNKPPIKIAPPPD